MENIKTFIVTRLFLISMYIYSWCLDIDEELTSELLECLVGKLEKN